MSAGGATSVRFNQRFRLVRVGSVAEVMRARLGQEATPSDYALLIPVSPGLTVKLVTPSVAEELEGLITVGGATGQEPGSVLAQMLPSLILDQIVECLVGERWLSGAEAVPAQPPHHIDFQNIGLSALLHAHDRDDLRPDALLRYLYEFGRKPFSRSWLEHVGGEGSDTLARWYGLNDCRPLAKLSTQWVPRRDRAWWAWYNPSVPPGTDAPTWKLYVGVEPRALPSALAIAAELLPGIHATAFKVPGHLAAVLRPDKFVIYFRDRQAMLTAGAELGESLRRLPPHPVAFTAAIPGCAQMFWGVDPPKSSHLDRGSWRSWLCSRAAGAVWGLRTVEDPDHYLSLLLDRLTAEGVSISDWTPTQALLNAWHDSETRDEP